MKYIKELTLVGITVVGMNIPNIFSSLHAQNNNFTGTVERVWEDGFRLDTGERTLRVDTWNVYGDNTPQNVAVGDRVSVTGEFDGGEFDANFVYDLIEPTSEETN